MISSRQAIVLVAALSMVAVSTAIAGALAGLCDLGARLTDVVGMRLTLLAGQLEVYRTSLVAASCLALAPAAWLGHRRGSEAERTPAVLVLRTTVWISAAAVLVSALFPWLLHDVL